MGIYSIRLANKSELDKLQEFIDLHWKNNHVLTLSKDLLNYQHLNNEYYNFLIAENKYTHDFDALIGFIPTCQFDPYLAIYGDYWGAIWKIRDDIFNDELNAVGFALWKRILRLPNFHSYAAIGISEIAKKIYSASRLNIGHFNQYYLLNNSIKDFKIAKIKQTIKTELVYDNKEWDIRTISPNELKRINIEAFYKPYKSITYLINKYVHHPVYNYRFLGIYKNKEIKCIWVIRDFKANGAKAIRVIDALGEVNGDLKYKLQRLLTLEKAEYIDFMNFGIPEEVFHRIGFTTLDMDGDTIIPNYFEPFERRNVKIELAYKANYDYIAFKGDSDQDRPNVL